MTVFLVGAGPGDPGLLTRRGAEVLSRAEVVLFDRLVDPRLLALAPPGALRIDVGKRPGQPRRQDEVNALLLEHARAGRTVVRLKGGDPYVFGRGGEEAEVLLAAGVPVEVVPGVTAAFAAPAAAGTPVTHRRLSSSVTVVSGHVGPAGSPAAVDWESLGRAGGTLVVMMGMAVRDEITRRLIDAGRSPDTPVLVVERGTTAAQASVRTTLAGLPAVTLGAPATIVVGAVAALDLSTPRHGPLTGRTVVVTRPAGRGASTADALVDAGARVVELPVIAVADPPDGGQALCSQARSVGDHGWVLFTSATAVARFMAALPDVRLLGGVAVGAVGPATARALAEHGVVADLVAEEHSAAGLVAAMGEAPGGGRAACVLFPRALDAAPVLATGLRARGWTVTEVDAYRTVTAGPAEGADADALDVAAGADAVTFASPSAVRAYLELSAARPRPPVVACIGAVTADAARAAGLEVDAVADDPSPAGLVAALEACFAGRGVSHHAVAEVSGAPPRGPGSAPR